MRVVLIKIVVGKLAYVLLNFLNTFNPSFNTLTLSKATLIHPKKLISIRSKHLAQKGIIIKVFTIPMYIMNHSFFLNMSLNWVPVGSNAHIIFSLEVVGLRPYELFIVDEFIIVLPIFESYSVTVFVFHVLAAHVACDCAEDYAAAADLFIFFQFDFLHVFWYFVREIFILCLGHFDHVLQLEESVNRIKILNSFGSLFLVIVLV